MDGVRRPKDDIAFRALGAVDEAQVTLGVCRSLVAESGLILHQIGLSVNRDRTVPNGPEGDIPLRQTWLRRLGRQSKTEKVPGLLNGGAALTRTKSHLKKLGNDLALFQKDLLVAGGILSSSPGDTIPDTMPLIDDLRIAFLSERFQWWRHQVHIEPRFFIGGDTRIGAEFDRARTVVRRAEREVVRLIRERGIQQQIPVSKYLNQLSDLCFVLARWSDHTFRHEN